MTIGGDDAGDRQTENKPRLKKRLFGSIRLRIMAGALFLAGAVAGTYVEEWLSQVNPEFFGPSVEEALAQQQFQKNFTAIQNKLDQMAKKGAPAGLRDEISALLKEQEAYVTKLQTALADAQQRAARTKSESLEGVARQTDFSLTTGRSVTVAARGNALGLLRFGGTSGESANVNLNGQRQWMDAGDQIPFKTEEEDCTVIYRFGDGQKGIGHFDLTCRPRTD